MTDERDPQLEALFADAQIETPNGAFADKVMEDVAHRRRNLLFTRAMIVLAIIALEVLLNAPIQGAIGSFIDVIGRPIIDLDDGWLAMALAPVNSAAGIVGALLLGLHFLYRKVLR